MKRNRLLHILFALLLLMGLSGCGGKDSMAETAPDGFTWSGGSGKTTITCDKVWKEDGVSYAEIAFSSTHYSYVRIDDTKYDSEVRDGASYITLPVTFNEPVTIHALTTAMSEPHEIEYRITVWVGQKPASGTDAEGKAEATKKNEKRTDVEDLTIGGSAATEEVTFSYAKGVRILRYEDGLSLIDVTGYERYLLVPADREIPDGLPDDIRIIRTPLERVYLANTAGMSLAARTDALSKVRFTSLEADAWYIDEPKQALAAGTMKYAGKYDAPDYEMLVSEKCDLAIENTMIFHAPEVMEQIESLGIPVLIDRSSYEDHPLGRTEWVKVYGELFGTPKIAEDFFASEEEAFLASKSYEKTGKTVAYFTVSSNGMISVRAPEDYISKMIGLAGGENALEDVKQEGDSGSVTISMESFYSMAKDADFLVYNATIMDPIATPEDLVAKNPLFADFKAVKEGNVWQVEKNMYQSTDKLIRMVGDLHVMLTDGDEKENVFLKKTGR